MGTVLDHTIVPAIDKVKASQWYSRLMGLENVGRMGPFTATRINDPLVFDYPTSEDFPSIHSAYAMETQLFKAVFERINKEGIQYRESLFDMEDVKGSRMTTGAKGQGKAVFIRDPSAHIFEIKTY